MERPKLHINFEKKSVDLESKKKSIEHENTLLKHKCNRLIEEYKKSQEQLNMLQNQIKNICESEDKIQENNENELFSLLQHIFFQINQRKMIIQYKNSSKNSKEFYKVQKRDFEKIIQGIEETQGEKIIEKIIEFIGCCGITKSRENGSIYWNDVRDGQATKIVLIRKAAFYYFLDRKR